VIAVEYTITVGGNDWTDDIISIAVGDSLMRVDAGEFTAYEKPDVGDEVVVSVNGTTVFRGYVARVRKTKSGAYHVTVFPNVARLKDRVIYLPKKYDGTDLAAAVREILSENLDGNSPYIVAPGSLPTGVTVSALRPMGTRLNALSAVVKSVPSNKASGHYEWYYNPASDAVDVAAYIGSETSVGTYTEDVNITLEVEPQEELYNRVIVVGNAGGDYTVYATADDTNSQSAYGIREKIVKTNRVLSTAEAQQLANALVKRYANPPVAGYASWLDPDSWPSIGLGDVITVVDSYGNSYTVRVSSRRWVLGDRFKFSVRFYSFVDDSDLSRALAELASDYIAPSGAPNVFHQTKSDNFAYGKPVTWRVYVPQDIDKTLQIQLSYNVSDYRAYAGNGTTSSYSGSSGSTAPDGDTASGYSYYTQPGADSSSVAPSINSATVDGNTGIPDIGATSGFTTLANGSTGNLGRDDNTTLVTANIPSTYVDYGYISGHLTVNLKCKVVGNTWNTTYQPLQIYAYLVNTSRNYTMDAAGFWYRTYQEESPPAIGDRYIIVHADLALFATYPVSWAGDSIAVKGHFIDYQSNTYNTPRLQVVSQENYITLNAGGFGKHYHYFSDSHAHSQASHSHDVTVDSHRHTVPSLDVDVDSHSHSVSVPSLSVTNTAGLSTSTYSGNFYVKIDGTQIYSGTDNPKTLDVTSHLTPGWHTVEFGTSTSGGKGFVDLLVEAKGRLRTFA